eukprot:Pgem_evm1s20128
MKGFSLFFSCCIFAVLQQPQSISGAIVPPTPITNAKLALDKKIRTRLEADRFTINQPWVVNPENLDSFQKLRMDSRALFFAKKIQQQYSEGVAEFQYSLLPWKIITKMELLATVYQDYNICYSQFIRHRNQGRNELHECLMTMYSYVQSYVINPLASNSLSLKYNIHDSTKKVSYQYFNEIASQNELETRQQNWDHLASLVNEAGVEYYIKKYPGKFFKTEEDYMRSCTQKKSCGVFGSKPIILESFAFDGTAEAPIKWFANDKSNGMHALQFIFDFINLQTEQGNMFLLDSQSHININKIRQYIQYLQPWLHTAELEIEITPAIVDMDREYIEQIKTNFLVPLRVYIKVLEQHESAQYFVEGEILVFNNNHPELAFFENELESIIATCKTAVLNALSNPLTYDTESLRGVNVAEFSYSWPRLLLSSITSLTNGSTNRYTHEKTDTLIHTFLYEAQVLMQTTLTAIKPLNDQRLAGIVKNFVKHYMEDENAMTKLKKKLEEDECAISFDKFSTLSDVSVTGCGHLFETSHLKDFFKTHPEKTECPVCRQSLRTTSPKGFVNVQEVLDGVKK